MYSKSILTSFLVKKGRAEGRKNRLFWSFLHSFVISIFAPSEVIDAAESFPYLQIPLASLSARKGKEGNL